MSLGHNELTGKEAISTWASWWRHQMETFSMLLVLFAGNSPVTGEFPSQRPVTQSFDISFDLHLNKRFSKQSWHGWFETPSHSLWRYCNGLDNFVVICSNKPLTAAGRLTSEIRYLDNHMTIQHTPKTTNCHDDNLVITFEAAGFHHDHLPCHQWQWN